MAPTTAAVAYAGSPAGNMPVKNCFAFTFSQPFRTPSDFVPREHALPRIEAERPIFVDNKSGTYRSHWTQYEGTTQYIHIMLCRSIGVACLELLA
jgi:hypothetical protein